MAQKPLTPPIPLFVGPTASGKSAAAIAWALKHNGEVISCDSRQVYRHLDIGTAKVTTDEMQGIPHHLVSFLDLDAPYSAGQFARDAERCIADILARGNLPVVAGGATLYAAALRDGLVDVPDIPPSIRQSISQLFSKEGLAGLAARTQRADPTLFERIDQNNPARLMRALEVFEATGIPLSEWQKRRSTPTFTYEVRLLNPERPVLHQRIESRLNAMLEGGWIEETRSILEMGYSPTLPPLQTIGYAQVIRYLQGELSREVLRDEILFQTRQYARRQVTYFSKFARIKT